MKQPKVWVRGSKNMRGKVINRLKDLGGFAPKTYNGEPEPHQENAIFVISSTGMIQGYYQTAPLAVKIMSDRSWKEIRL